MEGSGNITAQQRSVQNFTGVNAHGSVNVYLQQGAKQEVRIEGDDNLLPRIATFVENGQLRIDASQCYSSARRINVYITAPEISQLALTGSGRMITMTTIETKDLNTTLNGSGEMRISVAGNTVVSSLNGSGNIVLSGRTERFAPKVNGSGKINAQELSSINADVNVIGNGSADIHVTNILDATIRGTGSIRYTGNPETINQAISHSGRLVSAPRR
jgi:hypothetical protein